MGGGGMSDEAQVTMWISAIIGAVAITVVVSMAVYYSYELKHTEAMAAAGYEQVVEMLPGREIPERYWRKIDGSGDIRK